MYITQQLNSITIHQTKEYVKYNGISMLDYSRKGLELCQSDGVPGDTL